jgi:hypothetical protein
MGLKRVFGWVGFAALFTPVFASCAHTAEGFCQGWVEDTCQVLAGCCLSGEKFDPDGCRIQLSATCQTTFDVEKIHSGEYVFDSGAASTCYGTIDACADLAKAANQTYDLQKACGNAVTGYRPTGSACQNSKECAKAGDFPVCFTGALGGGEGVCAKAILSDDGKCGFSLTTNELKLCPDGKFCDTSGVMPNPGDPPTSQELEFSASCKSYVHEGGACGGAMAGQCDSGLYCDFGGGSICAKEKGEGSDCTSSNECTPGLTCGAGPNGMGQVCTKASGSYCYSPSVCGDGHCDTAGGETQITCPQDCGGGGGNCGDGVCDTGTGEQITCPQDCCGDGVCEPGETQTCPSDCP